MTDAEPPVLDLPWDLHGPEHEALRTRVRAWLDEHVAPQVEAWEAAGDFPRSLFAEAGAAGLFGWKVPPGFGGAGPDFLADLVVTEELARAGSGGVAAALGAHKDLGSYYLWRFGDDEQRRRWVVPAMAGAIVTGLGVTEPGTGSDVAGLRTRAVARPGGDWVLDGEKTFITNGSWGDVLVVAAVTDPDAGGHRGTTLFVVEAGDPGFDARRIPTLGWRTSHTGALSFSGVLLPADRVLGGEAMLGKGFGCIMRNFQWERVAMAAAAVVAAGQSLSRALDGPGGASVRWGERFGDLAVEAAAARALVDHAVRQHLHGQDAVREVSMAKWYACDLAVRVAEAALEAAGDAGLVADARAQRALRDARLGPIGGGTTEIMKEVIGRSLGL